MRPHPLVFSDLDGTLLDHHTYSYAGAVSALERLRKSDIPLILTSSKTRAEIEALQQRIQLEYPFIVENGGGLVFPPAYDALALPQAEAVEHGRMLRLGRPYAEIRRFFATVQEQFQLRGFGDMGCEEVAARTGLTAAEAALASRREFSEPFVFQVRERPDELAAMAATHGLALTKGGRFYHLLAADQDKGRAVRAAREIFAASGYAIRCAIGLGDSANDCEMLAAVDIPVLIPHPDGQFEPLALPGLRRAPAPGSQGWGTMIHQLLDELERS
ncbi:MAG: HAD-IIB family hydrolase [Thermodesulfobacteriota bacterium]